MEKQLQSANAIWRERERVWRMMEKDRWGLGILHLLCALRRRKAFYQKKRRRRKRTNTYLESTQSPTLWAHFRHSQEPSPTSTPSPQSQSLPSRILFYFFSNSSTFAPTKVPQTKSLPFFSLNPFHKNKIKNSFFFPFPFSDSPTLSKSVEKLWLW